MRTSEQNAEAICEALRREVNLIKRYGRYRVVLAILQGAEMREMGCDRCGASGKHDVECESSGGTVYVETRTCESCDGSGRVRRLTVLMW
ncbi:MAG TPA: hypothetical protein VMW52_07250 [Phycisphaerae bacterium]|nr:hypothetical protein [Phycisphaerae bacterium]